MFGELALTELLKIGGRFITDPDKKAEYDMEVLKLKDRKEERELQASTDLATGQMATNTEEAKSDNVFIAGWRPFVGWVCGTAFAYHFVLQPFIILLLTIFNRPIVKPAFDMETLLTVLFGILGLGGLRTLEKVKK